jgi:hypothetical protein
MPEYPFLVRLRLPAPHPPLEWIEDRLALAGCTDALVGLGLPGRVALSFERQAESAERAIASALHDLQQALPKAELAEIEPDLVGLSDAADMVGVTRQNLRKLMLGYPDTFPLPVHQGSTAIWHVADLLDWLEEHQGYDIDTTLKTVSKVARRLNPSLRPASRA